jgi:hypothetical protein
MFAPVSDAVLTAFVPILADNDLGLEFLLRWKHMCHKLTRSKVLFTRACLIVCPSLQQKVPGAWS